MYGAPGTGKSHGIEEVVGTYGDTVRTTFHPDSDYASFVGCYKPTMVRTKKTYVLEGREAEVKDNEGKPVCEEKIAYSFVPQAFSRAYVNAWRKIAQGGDGEIAPQFLVVEEINRGNCAQIFGDVFQLLDRGDDGYSKYPIDADADLAQYIGKELGSADAQERVPPAAGERDGGNSGADAQERVPPAAGERDGGNSGADAQERVPPEVRSGKKLMLPPNLYIWATMNTSDQSLFPMDSAFKRRWEWKYMPIKNAGEDNPRLVWKIVADGEAFSWWDFLKTINKSILDALKNEDKQLGYFFAKPDDDMSDIISASKFVNKVLFYLYNDVFRDYELPKGFAKSDGGKFAFADFFPADGSPDETKVKELLSNLLAKAQQQGAANA